MGLFDNLFGKKNDSSKLNISGKEYDLNPEALAYSQIGMEKYQQKDYNGSIEAFNRSIKLTPNNQVLYTMRGTAYEDMGNDIEAEKDFNKTLELLPTDSVAAYRLGMVFYRKKDFETAIKWLKVSFDNATEYDLEHMGIGKNNILFVAKKVIAGNLGNFLTQLKRYDEGFKYLDEAIKIDPNYGNPFLAKGMALAQIGKPKEGLPFLKKAAELGIPQAAHAMKLFEQLIQQEQSKQEHQDEEDLELEFVFHSSDHIRYENGKHVSGPHGSAPRAIKVEPNISGNKGYTVTLFNTDGGQAIVQMTPKQMKLISADNEKIVLRGYGNDSLGAAFEDYGLSVFHDDGTITKCILHMHDRLIDIEYIKTVDSTSNEPEVVDLARQAIGIYANDSSQGRQLLVKVYRSVKQDPLQLKNVTDYASVGKAFSIMIMEKLSDDIDNLQMMASVGYLCLSKAIETDKSNVQIYIDRLLLLHLGHEPLKYTVMIALGLGGMSFGISGQMAPIKARDAIYRMEIADLDLNPTIYNQIEFFNKRKTELDDMISREFFLPEKTKVEVVKKGTENHNQLHKYLVNRILEEGDVDF